jgi:hypothetical protein
MKLTLEIENLDIDKVKKLIKNQTNHKFVQHRIKKNLATKRSIIKKDHFWKSLIMCLLTTQQRSGEDSPVTKFLNLDPHPLSLKSCLAQKELNEYAFYQLTIAKGIRRTKNIANEIEINFNHLQKSNWEILDEINSLINKDDRFYERQIANNVQQNFKGIGPKQSRNLLQDLGLTKYETPIDSRIIRWLNELEFPIPLSATVLQDKPYYNYVSDIIFELCEKAEIKPCVLDAAIFSFYEKNNY